MGRLFKRSLNAFSLVSEIEMVYTMLGMAHNWWAIRWQFLSVKALSSRFSVALAGKAEVRSCMVSDAFKCFWPNHFSLPLSLARKGSFHSYKLGRCKSCSSLLCKLSLRSRLDTIQYYPILSNGWPTSVYQCVPECTPSDLLRSP